MAADAFAARHGLSLEEANGKFVVRKPAPDAKRQAAGGCQAITCASPQEMLPQAAAPPHSC